jgi:hypothetical protein
MHCNGITVPRAPVTVDGASSVIPSRRSPNQTPAASILRKLIDGQLIDKRAPD